MLLLEYYNKSYCLEVAGDLACFSRPEMKVERVSYDVITPSAARGIFQAVFWKPAIRWIVRKIEVMNEIRWISVRRNELGTVMSNKTGIFIEDNRQQRAGLLLRDVCYRLHAELEFIHPDRRPKVSNPVSETLVSGEEKNDLRKDENPGKYYGIFERRMKKGQCFNQPYLGCREFSCSSLRLIDSLDEEPAPIGESKELGFMLYDLDYSDERAPKPAFFRARMNRGVVDVPDWSSEEVRR